MPLAIPIATDQIDPALLADLRTLVRFVEVYCHHRHREAGMCVVDSKVVDLQTLAGHAVTLCPECAKLLNHALVKRSICPMQPKPACKHCPRHCYHPTYRQQIKEVMKYSGRRLVLSGRLDLLWHLLF